MTREELILILKAQQWEKCKGELKSLVALESSAKRSCINDLRLQQLDKFVNAFIADMEDNDFIYQGRI